MAPKATPDESAAFLWCCLKNSEFKQSMVDWDAVAAQLNIKKGAATMRYYRLAKALNGPAGDEAGPSALAGGSAKETKRKAGEVEDDEEEGEAKPKTKKTKRKGNTKKEGAEVKTETSGDELEVEGVEGNSSEAVGKVLTRDLAVTGASKLVESRG